MLFYDINAIYLNKWTKIYQSESQVKELMITLSKDLSTCTCRVHITFCISIILFNFIIKDWNFIIMYMICIYKK